MTQRTYVNRTPDSTIEARYPGAFVRLMKTASCYVVAEVDDAHAGEIAGLMAALGWEDLGAGDLRPPAYDDAIDPAVATDTFTAPALLTSAAKLSDAEALRAACVRLEVRQDQILAALTLRGILSGTE